LQTHKKNIQKQSPFKRCLITNDKGVSQAVLRFIVNICKKATCWAKSS